MKNKRDSCPHIDYNAHDGGYDIFCKLLGEEKDCPNNYDKYRKCLIWFNHWNKNERI